MKSYYVELIAKGKSQLSTEEIDVDNLAENEAIIKAEYSMISAGTELSRAFALKQGFEYPVRPGYCMVGRILDKGKDIKAEIGDRVFVNAPHASIVRRSSGSNVQGPIIMKLDDDIDPVWATSINLMLVALQGVNLADVKLGYTVGIFGLGNIGILTALMYKKLGCKVIGYDLVKQRCDLAKSMGIDYVVSDDNQKTITDDLTNNKGLDIAVDASGLSEVIISCIENTKPYGQVLLLGSPRQSYECDITQVMSMIHMKNLKVIGAFNKTAPVYAHEGSDNSLERNFAIVCNMLRNKDVDISKLISKVIDPEECENAYYDLMYNKDKVNCIVYDWSKY